MLQRGEDDGQPLLSGRAEAWEFLGQVRRSMTVCHTRSELQTLKESAATGGCCCSGGLRQWRMWPSRSVRIVKAQS